MKCHYDVLCVSRQADLDEIKKAYKKLAIKWHPDKNLDNTEEATEQFQLIQQAFEVLSDPHERAWYDDHREAILKGKVGGDCEDDSLDVYQYFTASCYKGFGDNDNGFYSVYREVFNKIAAEDSDYYVDGDSDYEVPSFGTSNSSAEEVKMFYAHWQSYCTKKTYAWLDPYDSRTAENRKLFRLVDKENKKVRDKARKARNEEVRELVSFVRKRDKRVQAHAMELQRKNAEKAIKTEEKRQENIKKRAAELASHKESDWSKFSNFETELKNIEASLVSEFGDAMSDDSAESIADDQLYCVACNKLFKTPKAFENHESSKKHKENIIVLKQRMLEGSESDNYTDDKESSVEEGEVLFEYNGGGIEEDFQDDPLFCTPCGKQFKTLKAIDEHKKTKKHLDNYELYKEAMFEVLGDEAELDKDPLKNIGTFSDPKFKTYFKDEEDVDGPCEEDEEVEQLYKEIDEFTKDSDIIKERVDNICEQFDEVFGNTNDHSSNNEPDNNDFEDQFVNEVLKPLKKGLKNSRRQSLIRDIVLDSDEDDLFTESRIKPKRKQKLKSKTNSKKQISRPETKADSDIIDCNEKDTESSISQDSVLNTNSSSTQEKIPNKNNIKNKKPSEDSSQDSVLNTNSSSTQEKIPNKNNIKNKKPSEDSSQDSVLNTNSFSTQEKIPTKKNTKNKKQSETNVADTNLTCAVCKASFSSKNKLFLHLSNSGHSVYIGNKDKVVNKVRNKDSEYIEKKSKNKRK